MAKWLLLWLVLVEMEPLLLEKKIGFFVWFSLKKFEINGRHSFIIINGDIFHVENGRFGNFRLGIFALETVTRVQLWLLLLIYISFPAENWISQFPLNPNLYNPKMKQSTKLSSSLVECIWLFLPSILVSNKMIIFISELWIYWNERYFIVAHRNKKKLFDSEMRKSTQLISVRIERDECNRENQF